MICARQPAIDHKFAWPNGTMGAVSLTYDDALPCHFESVAPLLEAHDLRATFNVIIGRATFRNNLAAWQELAARGHELGNHTVFHPCRAETPDERPTQDPGYNLCDYSERRFRDEIELANWVLAQADGRRERTYANTCSHNALGRGENKISLEPILADYFVAARGVRTNRAVDMARVNYQNLGTCGADSRAFDDLKTEIAAAVAAGNWIIYTTHGVGAGTHKLYADASEHRRLIEWLCASRSRIWTAPIVEVARYLLNHEHGVEQSQMT